MRSIVGAFALLATLLGGCSSDQARALLGRAPAVTARDHAAKAGGQQIDLPTSVAARAGRAFAAAPDRGDLIAYPAQATVRRDGAYTWHRTDLSETHALRAIDGQLTVTAPSGEVLKYTYQRHVEHPSGDWSWIGRLEGETGEEALITFGAKAAFGSIGQAGKSPLRLTVRDGVSWLVETDDSAVARLDSPATRPRGQDFLLPPDAVREAGVRGTSYAAVGTEGANPPVGAPVVDLVLGYTTGFAAGLGGDSQALTRLNNLVDIANQAYVNSQVNGYVRLVRAVAVVYPDATDNEIALQELTGYKAGTGGGPVPVSPALQPLRQAREENGADLVSLVRKFNDPENDGCGIAWLLGGGQTGIDNSDVPFGYSVVSDGSDPGNDGKTYFCRDETLAHELGHNMGSQHDRKTATVDGVLKYGVFNYSFGFKTDSTFGNFFTIMAYGESGQSRYRVFSNPRVNFCGGLVCGIENDADNARSLNQTFPIIAGFRATVVPVPPPTTPGTGIRPRNDIDADGKSDLLLQNASSGLSAYWIMSGNVPTRYSAAFTDPAGYSRVATGDFNGDARLDIVWARGGDRHLLLWQGDGNGFTALSIGNYSAGWQVVEAGDIDADGKSDLLLQNAASGLSAYWIMSGAVPTRYSAAFTEPAGYTRAATGDFNGDSRLDIVWARSSDRHLLLWQGDGNGFVQASIGNYSAGWQVVEAGDIDADGKSDLLLQNAGSGLTAYWIMSGAVPVRYSAAFTEPAGYTRAATGDFNGDRRLDIVWARSSDRHLLLWQGDGNGFVQASIGNYSAGWQVVDRQRTVRAKVRGDINGDGKSDLLLRNPTMQNAVSGYIAYWIMSGNLPIGYSPVFTEPFNQPLVAAGDLDGNGRMDLVWTHTLSRSLRTWMFRAEYAPGYSESGISAYSEGWSVTGASDIDGDGKSDLLLENVTQGLIAYWIMNGNNVVRYSVAFKVPAGYSRVATGDFNGDGLLDIVWARASDRHLLIWQGDGTGFNQVAIGNYSAGWQVVDSGDFDADGKSDLLLQNSGSGLTAYWIMNGAVPARYSPAFAEPTGYTRAATGDYNGDGKLDLVWVRSSDRNVLMWLGDGTGFAASPVGTHSEGWLITNP